MNRPRVKYSLPPIQRCPIAVCSARALLNHRWLRLHSTDLDEPDIHLQLPSILRRPQRRCVPWRARCFFSDSSLCWMALLFYKLLSRIVRIPYARAIPSAVGIAPCTHAKRWHRTHPTEGECLTRKWLVNLNISYFAVLCAFASPDRL